MKEAGNLRGEGVQRRAVGDGRSLLDPQHRTATGCILCRAGRTLEIGVAEECAACPPDARIEGDWPEDPRGRIP